MNDNVENLRRLARPLPPSFTSPPASNSTSGTPRSSIPLIASYQSPPPGSTVAAQGRTNNSLFSSSFHSPMASMRSVSNVGTPSSIASTSTNRGVGGIQAVGTGNTKPMFHGLSPAAASPPVAEGGITGGNSTSSSVSSPSHLIGQQSNNSTPLTGNGGLVIPSSNGAGSAAARWGTNMPPVGASLYQSQALTAERTRLINQVINGSNKGSNSGSNQTPTTGEGRGVHRGAAVDAMQLSETEYASCTELLGAQTTILQQSQDHVRSLEARLLALKKAANRDY